MKRFSFLIFCLMAPLSLWAQTSSMKEKSLSAEGRWVVWERRSGVEIYVQHRKSTIDTRFNTLVRLRNSSNSTHIVSFRPSFGCIIKTEKSRDTSDGGVVRVSKSTLVTYQHGEVKVNIYPKSSVTLLAYRPCKGEIPTEINFTDFKVRRR